MRVACPSRVASLAARGRERAPPGARPSVAPCRGPARWCRLGVGRAEARAADLKRLCGAGGGVKDGAVEIQGDHRERVAARLRELGYTVKLAGG